MKYAAGDIQLEFKMYGKTLFIEGAKLPFLSRYDQVFKTVETLGEHMAAEQIMFTTENPAILAFLRKKGWEMETAIVKMPVRGLN
jgi:hypothetical protein